MPGGERRRTDDVDVGFDGLAGDLFRRLEQRPDVDIEPEVGERGGDHLLATVVTVLAHLGDQDARPAAVRRGELVDLRSNCDDGISFGTHFGSVHPFDRADGCDVTTVDVLEGVADLPHRRLGASGIDREGEQVALTSVGGVRKRVEGGVDVGLIALGPQLIELRQLGDADLGVLDLEDLDVVFLVGRKAVLVDPDHRLLTRIDAGLGAGGGLLDAQLRDAGLNRGSHAAHFLDLGDVRHGLVRQFIGEPLDMVAAAPRVDGAGRAALLLQEQLGVASDTRREVGGQRERFVEGVGMQ